VTIRRSHVLLFHSSRSRNQTTEAAKLLADVQKDMATRNDRGSDAYLQTWKDLYWLREKLSELTKYGFVLCRGDLPAVKTPQSDVLK
jgi:hypothetical protein